MTNASRRRPSATQASASIWREASSATVDLASRALVVSRTLMSASLVPVETMQLAATRLAPTNATVLVVGLERTVRPELTSASQILALTEASARTYWESLSANAASDGPVVSARLPSTGASQTRVRTTPTAATSSPIRPTNASASKAGQVRTATQTLTNVPATRAPTRAPVGTRWASTPAPVWLGSREQTARLTSTSARAVPVCTGALASMRLMPSPASVHLVLMVCALLYHFATIT